jgi:choline dehydrogenase-like flavoprotein
MHRAFLLALLPLAACTTADVEAQAPAGKPALEAIAFQINSWGRSIGSWEVHADGTVSHVHVEGSVFNAHRREHREFTVDGSAFRKMVAIAAGLPEPRPNRDECKERATDLPYGTLTLSRGGREEAIAFDTGCLDASYQAFVGKLRAMDELVDGWAEQQPVDRVEEVARQ